MRLNLYISRCGLCSRRKADEYIFAGRVKVDGIVAKFPWLDIKEDQTVEVDNKKIVPLKKVYAILNKPAGFICTLKDKFASKNITALFPPRCGRLYPVGRLDKNTRGLLILTNDGDFANRVLHPRFQVEKEYLLEVHPPFRKCDISKVRKGVKDAQDILRVKKVVIESSYRGSLLRVVVQEGKKRHLRRLFQSLGYRVSDLKRIRIGGLRLGNLKEGEFKFLDAKDVCRVFEK